MTSWIKTAALIAALTLPLTYTATADETAHDGDRAKRRAAVLEKFDADGSGDLSDTEKAAAKAARAERGDRPERGDRSERRAEMLKTFDADGSGDLNDEEKAARKAAVEARIEEHLDNPKDRVLKKFDADGSGDLSDAEKATARTAIAERRAERRQKHQNRRNGDEATN